MLSVVEQPGILAVDLMHAKMHLRIDNTIEDSYIGGLIQAASEAIESYINKSLIYRVWRLDRNLKSGHHLVSLPKGPVRRIRHITLHQQELKSSIKRFYLNDHNQIEFFIEKSGRIDIEYEAGLGMYPNDVPEILKTAILMLLTDMYEKRDTRVGDAVKGLHQILAPFLQRRLI